MTAWIVHGLPVVPLPTEMKYSWSPSMSFRMVLVFPSMQYCETDTGAPMTRLPFAMQSVSGAYRVEPLVSERALGVCPSRMRTIAQATTPTVEVAGFPHWIHQLIPVTVPGKVTPAGNKAVCAWAATVV